MLLRIEIYLSARPWRKGSSWTLLLRTWVLSAEIKLALHPFEAFRISSWFLWHAGVVKANNIRKAYLIIDAILNLLLQAYMTLDVHKVYQNRNDLQHLAFAVGFGAAQLLAAGVGGRRHVASAWSLRRLSLAQLKVLGASAIVSYSWVWWKWQLCTATRALRVGFLVDRLKVWILIGFIGL